MKQASPQEETQHAPHTSFWPLTCKIPSRQFLASLPSFASSLPFITSPLAMQFGQVFDSFFNKGFRGPKCKTLLKLSISRIKLLRNKRENQLKQSRRELAQLLKDGQEPTACIRVEHIIREQNIMETYDILELYCELLVVRIPMIESQRECPLDLQEAVASLIFAAPRSADLPELLEVQNMFAGKYGREFVATAAELRPDCGVNRQIIERLSARAPSMQLKLNTMKEIAEENDVKWDIPSTELEFLELPEDLLDGPSQFTSATQLPYIPSKEDESSPAPMDLAKIKSKILQEKSSFGSTAGLGSRHQSIDSFEETKFIPFLVPPKNEKEPAPNGFYSPPREISVSQKSDLAKEFSFGRSLSRTRSEGSMSLQDVIEAAETAAESAEKAAQAARAAADLCKSRLSVKSVDQNENEGWTQLNSNTETDRPVEIGSKPLLSEETGMMNDVHSPPESDDETQDHLRAKNKRDNGSYDIFDISTENVPNYESVHVAESGREKGSIFDAYGDDDDGADSTYRSQAPTKGGNVFPEGAKFSSSAPFQPGSTDFMGESREGHQNLNDFSGAGDGKVKNYPRLPSLEDDPYCSYPNLFSKPSSGSNY